MNTQQQIQAIKQAIDDAENFRSGLSDEALQVPFLGSLKIRALVNNLGKLATHFGECGSHKGGSFCSTIFGNDNLKTVTAIDSWESDHMNGDLAYPQFIENANKFISPQTKLNVIISDCFSVDLSTIEHKWDLFGYDAGHSFTDQRDALVYYKPVLADTFIYCCDDWTYGDVKAGTMAGIAKGGYRVLFERELLNTTQGEDLHLNMEWWRGYYVALLKKKA